MNPKLRLKVFPVVLLTVVQVVGMGGVARSQQIQQSPVPSGSGDSRQLPNIGSDWLQILRLWRLN